MALGKICLHEEPLPGFVQYDSPHSTGVSSPIDANVTNHRRIRKGDRNVDVVPGLAYFAYATDILGGLQGNDLPFMQANLLAALYTAQLACVIESWIWIRHACRICGFLVQDASFRKEKNEAKVDLIRFAYLTCLQLEGDILAELDLQPAGVQNIDPENEIGPPKDTAERSSEISIESRGPELIMVYYSYQLCLSKLINDWQKFLYPPRGSEFFDQITWQGDEEFSIQNRNSCEQTLLNLRSLIQMDPRVRWEDSDEPSSDINAARLRGKYYGAKCIIHRPFLHYALHHFEEEDLTPEVMERFHEYEKNPQNFNLEDHPVKYVSKEKRSQWLVFQVLISCWQWVGAAKLSTTAFDGVLKQKRLIDTNIFGTAHA